MSKQTRTDRPDRPLADVTTEALVGELERRTAADPAGMLRAAQQLDAPADVRARVVAMVTSAATTSERGR